MSAQRKTGKFFSSPKAMNKGSNVIHLGKKKSGPQISPSDSHSGYRMASGGDVIPSESDPRFKDI